MSFDSPWEPKILPHIPDEEIDDEDDYDYDDDSDDDGEDDPGFGFSPVTS